jgi:hypothetical protein
MTNIKQTKLPSIIIKTLSSYKSWHTQKKNIQKDLRYSMCIKIDNLYIEILEKLTEAQYSMKDKKIIPIETAIIKVDVLKFLIFTLYDVKGISEEVFISISNEIDELGRMLFGWKNQVLKFLEDNKKTTLN